MERTLVLTGRGYSDYVIAAAMTLKKYPKAELLAMSRCHLPEFMERVEGYDRIVILGVGLSGDAERLAKALKRLKKDGVNVVWLSGIDFPAWMGDDIRANLEAHVYPGSDIIYAVAETYGLECNEFDDYCSENTQNGMDYLEMIEAADYFQRSYQDDTALPRVIRHIAAKHDKSKWTSDEQQMVEHFRRYSSCELIGKSNDITELREKINRIAPFEHARVMIMGETGTGKEAVATQIHNKSPRRKEPLVSFNCACMASDILESRFLGYKKGAFTGAVEDRKGLFEAADGGTLFLDEIGELPPEAQGLLLRVLERGRFYPVGESKKEVTVDVRVIVATNRDLPSMVREGKFRADLYQRLSAIQLFTPPLRHHKEDIPLLVCNFRKRNKMEGNLTPEQCEALMEYDYPGNVRELFNLLERAEVMGIKDYRQLIREHREINARMQPQVEVESPDNLEEATRLHVKRVFEKYGGNITRAAAALDVSRNTVRKYLEEK